MNRTTVNEELKRQRSSTPAASNENGDSAHSLRCNENRSTVKNCSSSPSGPKTPRLGEGMRSQTGICPDSSHVSEGEPNSRTSSRLSPTSAASSNMPGGWPSEHAESSSRTSSSLGSQRSSGTCSRLETATCGAIPPHARRMAFPPDHSGADGLSRQQAACGYREGAVVSSPISRDRDGDIIMMESGVSVPPITGKSAHPVTIRRKVEATSSKPRVLTRQNSKDISFEALTKENSTLPAPVVTANELCILVSDNKSQEHKLAEVDLSEKPKQKVRFVSLPKPCSPTSQPATRPPTPALAPRTATADFQYGCDSSEAALRQHRRTNPSLASSPAYEARKEPEDALTAPELPVTPATPSLPLSPSPFDRLGDISSAPAVQQDINNSPRREHTARVVADRAELSYKPSATSGAERVTESARCVQAASRRFSETQANWYYPGSTSPSISHLSPSPENEGAQHTFVCCHCDGPILLSSLEWHRCSFTPSSVTDHIPYTSSIRAGPRTNRALPDLPLPVPHVPTLSQPFYGQCPPARDVTRQRLHDKLQCEYEAESPTIAKNRQMRAEWDIEPLKEVAKKERRVEERMKAIKEEEAKEQKKKEKASPPIPDVSGPHWRSRMQTPWERDAFSVPSNGVPADVVGVPASQIGQKSAPKKEESEASGVNVRLTEDALAHRSATTPISIPTPTLAKTPSTPALASAPTNLPLRAKAPPSETKQDATPTPVPPPTTNNPTLYTAPSPRPTPTPASHTTPPPPPHDPSPPSALPPSHQAPRLTSPQKAAIQPPKPEPQADSIAKPEVTAIAIAKGDLDGIPLSPAIDIEDGDWMRIDEETDAGEEWEVVE